MLNFPMREFTIKQSCSLFYTLTKYTEIHIHSHQSNEANAKAQHV